MSAIDGGGIEFAQPIPESITGRQVLIIPVCGWLTGDAARIQRMLVEIDGQAAGELRLDEPVPPRLWGREVSNASGKWRGFAGEILLDTCAEGHVHIVKLTRVVPHADHQPVSVHRVTRVGVSHARLGEGAPAPRIAICMAVYNPDAKAFSEQVRSIVDQTFGDWICIVNDDGSDAAHRAVIHDTISSDSRFHYFRNEVNVGFYRNFETALARVPEGVEFIALADQDDSWYPHKLQCLVDAMDPDCMLSYSDMRIVSDDGEVIAASYWGWRMNSFDDLRLMLVANTVTGAACMMRRSMLDLLLPFPQRVGEAFHDHWIACAALAAGRISYVDKPLYDYIQHGTSVIGHCGFEPTKRREESHKHGVLRYLRPANLRSAGGRFIGAGQAVYWHECRRIESLCRNLLARIDTDAVRRSALMAYGRGFRSMWSLIALSLRTRDSARLTDNAERRLAHGYLVHGALRLFHRRS